MANNRLIAVCLNPHCENAEQCKAPAQKTILKYYPSQGWYPTENNDEFFEAHKHGGMFGNYIVFVPEIRGLDDLNRESDGVVADHVVKLLHGSLKGHCDIIDRMKGKIE